MFTTWDAHCGISTFSKYLAAELGKLVDVEICRVDPSFTTEQFRAAAENASGDIAHLQHASSIYVGHEQMLFDILHGKGMPVVLTTHASDFAQFFRRVEKVIALNRTQRGGYSDESMPIIPGGTTCLPRLDKEQARRELGITRKYVVTQWGFILPHKQYQAVLDALAGWDDTTYLLAGSEERDPGYWAQLQNRIMQLSPRAEIVKTGFFPETQLGTVFSASDLLVFPYMNVIDSACLRYALGSGVLCLGIPATFIQEIHADYGIPVLGQSIRWLLENKVDGYEARCKHFLDETSWAKIAQKHVDLYNQILETKK